MKKNLKLLAVMALSAMMFAACTPEDPQEPGVPVDVDYFNVDLVAITPTNVTVKVQPTEHAKALYYWDVAIDDGSYAFDQDFVYDYLDDFYETSLVGLEMTTEELPFEEFLEAVLIPSEYEDEYTVAGLQPETKYVVWVAMFNEFGIAEGEVLTIPFTSAPVVPSDMTFQVTLDTNNQGESNMLVITPSVEDDPYVYYYGGERAMAEFVSTFSNDGTVKSGLIGLAKYMLAWPSDLYTGVSSEDCKGYLEDGTNYVYVMGYNGGVTTEMFTFEFEYDYIAPDDSTMEDDAESILYTYGQALIFGDYGGKYEGLNFCEIDLWTGYEWREYEEDDMLIPYKYPNYNDHMMEIRIFLPVGEEMLVPGTYPISTVNEEGVAQAGYIDEDGYLNGTHYFYTTNYDPYALINDGSVTISAEAGAYTMEFDFTSGENTITGRFEGEMEIEMINY